jgi:hypothetical protein
MLTLAFSWYCPCALLFLPLPSEPADSPAPRNELCRARITGCFDEPPTEQPPPASEACETLLECFRCFVSQRHRHSAWSVIRASAPWFSRRGGGGQTLRAASLETRMEIGAPESCANLFSKLCVEIKVSARPQLRVWKISAPMAVDAKEPAVRLACGLSGQGSEVRLEQFCDTNSRTWWAGTIGRNLFSRC